MTRASSRLKRSLLILGAIVAVVVAVIVLVPGLSSLRERFAGAQPEWLLFAGLLDTLQLMVHPVVAGSGTHLFQPGDPATRLVLQDSRITSKGNALLSYGLRRD